MLWTCFDHDQHVGSSLIKDMISINFVKPFGSTPVPIYKISSTELKCPKKKTLKLCVCVYSPKYSTIIHEGIKVRLVMRKI